MKILYIAGPFSAPEGDPDPLHTIEANILAASRIALEAARKGWMPVCPHKNTAGFQHCLDIPVSHWYDGDIELMKRCDAVLLIPGWRESKGAAVERAVAIASGIPFSEYERGGMPTPEHLEAVIGGWPRGRA